jgi:hypothetical protein
VVSVVTIGGGEAYIYISLAKIVTKFEQYTNLLIVDMAELTFSDIPTDLIWAHILPKDPETCFSLFQHARSADDHNFLKSYGLLAVKEISKPEWYTPQNIHCLTYMITHLDHKELVSWLRYLGVPYPCEGGSRYMRDIVWDALIRRNDPDITRIVLHACGCNDNAPCCNCASEVVDLAINRGNLSTMKDTWEAGGLFQTHHLFQCIDKGNRVLTEFMFKVMQDDDYQCEYTSYHIKYMMPYMTEVYASFDDDYMTQLYDVLLQTSQKANSMTKHGRWVRKQLQRVQKLCKVPGFRNMAIDFMRYALDEAEWDD